MIQEDISPKCVACGGVSAVVKLVPSESAVRFIYSGPGGSNGNLGHLISTERAAALRSALPEPFTPVKFHLAGLYDGAGFCPQCSAFYCSTHWNTSATGGGQCPNGHFKSLDPHWS